MDIASIAILLLATIGPTRAAIVFVGMTKSADAELKRKIAFRTVLVSAIVCCIFVVLGSVILGALKISIPALLIAGGLILFAFALPVVIAKTSKKNRTAKRHRLQSRLPPIRWSCR
jgi:multiple antibiotic resistance protein